MSCWSSRYRQTQLAASASENSWRGTPSIRRRSMPTTSGDPMPNCTRYRNADTVRLRRATPMTSSQCDASSSRPPAPRIGATDQYRDAVLARGSPSASYLLPRRNPTTQPSLGFLIARCLPDEWEIENVVVDADRRRQGIARSLIQELRAAAELAGVSSIILEVRESNLAAVRLYENIGFKSRRPTQGLLPGLQPKTPFCIA